MEQELLSLTELQSSLPSLVWYLLLKITLQVPLVEQEQPYRAPEFPPLFSLVPVTQSLVRAPEFPPLFSVVPVSQSLVTELQSYLPSLVFLNL